MTLLTWSEICNSPREPAPRACRPATCPGPSPPTKSANNLFGSKLFELSSDSRDGSRPTSLNCTKLRGCFQICVGVYLSSGFDDNKTGCEEAVGSGRVDFDSEFEFRATIWIEFEFGILPEFRPSHKK